ncbi:hypothetical protein K525DRAFT_246579, partial [Schizophyllum commune Loenen D]
VDDDQPLADAQEAVLAGLTDTYRDDRPGSHQNYDSALRDSWPDAKRASEGVQRAGAGVQRAGSRGGRGAPYAGDANRGDRDAKRPTPGRQDNPHASNAFKSVYSNVDSVYSQDDDRASYYASNAGASYYPSYMPDDRDMYPHAEDEDQSGHVPTVVVSSPIASTSSRQPSRQPIQQHIRNFSRPMPQPDDPILSAPSTAFDPHASTISYADSSYTQDDSFAHDTSHDSFAHGPSANFSSSHAYGPGDPSSNGLSAGPLPRDGPSPRPTLTTTASSRAVVVTSSPELPSTIKPVRPYISTEHLEEQKRAVIERNRARGMGGGMSPSMSSPSVASLGRGAPSMSSLRGGSPSMASLGRGAPPGGGGSVRNVSGGSGYGGGGSSYGSPSSLHPSQYASPSQSSNFAQPPPSPKPNPYMTHSPSP